MSVSIDDVRAAASRYGFNELFYKDDRTHVFYNVEKEVRLDFLPKSSTLRVWKRDKKQLYKNYISPTLLNLFFKEPENIKMEKLVRGEEGKKLSCMEEMPFKIHLGKIPETIDEDDIKEHFASYGTLKKFVRPIDKANNYKPKNFCFLTFHKEEVAKKLVKKGECTIKGEKISIKRVHPKKVPNLHKANNKPKLGECTLKGGKISMKQVGENSGFGGTWGYADPYTRYGGYTGYEGYGGYGGGYSDPYAGYDRYGGVFGGGWGEGFGHGCGRGGRPY